jgi:hypothetical protein
MVKKKVVVEFSKEKKFSKNIFLTVFLIILILFIVVFSAIMFFDDYKRKNIEDEYYILQQQIVLDEIYKSYLEESENKCEVLKNQLNSYLIVNNQLYKRLQKINKNAIVESDDRTKLLFILTNIKLWLHYNTIESECDSLETTAILYFYPEFKEFSIEKAEADAKTVVFAEKLDKLSRQCNFHSIALPYVDYIPIVNQLIIDYDINFAPSAYINGNVYYDINFSDTFLKEINCNN